MISSFTSYYSYKVMILKNFHLNWFIQTLFMKWLFLQFFFNYMYSNELQIQSI